MKILLLTSIFLSFSLHAKTLKIFSMNLHCGLGDWQSRLNTVIAEIIKKDPDVIGLQEVCYNNEMNMTSFIVHELKRFKYPVKFVKTTDTHQSFLKFQEQLLIISKKKVSSVVDMELPSVKFFENRLLGIEVGGVWAVTTHLHFALPQIRESQYHKISDYFSDKKVVLFGDLNSNPANGEASILHQENWKHYFPGPSYPSENPTKTFDGFWTSDSLSKKIKSSESVLIFKNHPYPPSDHLGVFMKIQILI